MDRCSVEYKRAFEAYLRHGTPMIRSLKQARSTAYYIWRTREDGNVRPEHAANNGKVFAWDDPPPTGHPGEDYGCRCTAEPYEPAINEHIDITLSGVSDTGPPWSSRDFVHHYYNGRGRAVTLRQTGHLASVVSEYIDRREAAIKDHIATEARKIKNGSFQDDFYRTYGMMFTVFSLGDTTIGGEFSGNSSEKEGVLTISGQLDFYHKDAFEDPLDIGMEIIDIEETIYQNIYRPVEERIRQRINQAISRQLRLRKQDQLGIHTGKPYPITDTWSGSFKGNIYADASKSSFYQKDT